MNILAIETSCDETAVALIESDGSLFTVRGNALYSQAKLHEKYGGVYPNLAKREHQKNLVPLTIRALTEANLLQPPKPLEASLPEVLGIREEEFRNDVAEFLKTYAKPDIGLIAVTNGPGLEVALWSGVSFAEALGAAWETPVVPIDHMEGHIVSALLKQEVTGNRVQVTGSSEFEPVTHNLPPVTFPILALLISGGHTELVLMREWFEYELVGRTRDDAVGEAFDKVARILGMPYPGGPEIARAAQRAREGGKKSVVTLPRPMIQDNTCDFSFSGLKTAVLYLVRGMKTLTERDRETIACEFEDAVRDVMVEKTRRALEKTGARTLAVGGGVAANAHIRKGLENLVRDEFPHVTLFYPDPSLTGDNAVMIGIAAALRASHGKLSAGGAVEARGAQSLAQH